jgi:hypothetical protein
MKKLYVATAALLAGTVLSMPAFAADSTEKQIQMLKEQLRMMQQQLDALQTANQAQSDSIAAETAAREAYVKEEQKKVLDAGGHLVFANGKTEAVPAPPKHEWWNDTTISGRMYYNISHSEVKVNGVKTAGTATGFDIKRFYLGVDHKFDKTFSANLTMDFNYDSGPAAATQFYIKKAYLRANFGKELDIRVGSSDLPWVPFAEDVYGYRYIENTLIDRTKFGTSADWGVHVSGEKNFDDLKLGYAVAAIDGSGYKHPLRSKSIDVEGRVNVEYKGLIAAVGGYTGKLGKSFQGTPTPHRAERLDALAAYKDKQFRIGVEYFTATNWNNVATAATDTAWGVGPFASYQFDPKWSVFGKYEYVKPNAKTKDALHDDYFNIGISYTPVKIVDLALVYKRDKAVNGTISTSNGTIGGSASGTYDEFGLWGQLRW